MTEAAPESTTPGRPARPHRVPHWIAFFPLYCIGGCCLFGLNYGDAEILVTGQVTDHAGQPIPGARVKLIANPKSRNPITHQSVADGEGKFFESIGLAPSWWNVGEVQVEAAGFAPVTLPLKTKYVRDLQVQMTRLEQPPDPPMQ